VDRLSSYPLGRGLGSPSDEGTTLLGVDEMLAMEELELPVLLDKSANKEAIAAKRGPKDSIERECGLRRSHVLWSETM